MPMPHPGAPTTPATTADTVLHLLGDGTLPPRRVKVVLAYHDADPLAVHLHFRPTRDRTECWAMARKLLVAGLRHPVGVGDVRIEPPAAPRLMRIHLHGDTTGTFLVPDPAAIADFLARTAGAADLALDAARRGMDAELAAILAGGHRG